MNYELISIGVLLAFTCAGVVALLRQKPQWLIWQLSVGLGFGGFNSYFGGTIWFPAKITMFFGLLYVFFFDHSWIKLIRITRNQILWTILFSIAFSIIVAYSIDPVANQLPAEGVQGRAFRPLIQGYTYVSTLAIFPLTLISLNSRKRIKEFFDVYVWSGFAVSLIALYQLFVLQTGGSFMPILRLHGRHSKEAAFFLMGLRLERLYAFAGEPKTLAVFILPALFSALFLIAFKSPALKPSWAKIWILLILTFVYLFTFSSAGLVALAVGLLLVGCILSVIQKLAIFRITSLAIIAFFVVQLVFGMIVSPESHVLGSNSPEFGQIFYERSVGRISDELETRYEFIALNYIWNQEVIGLPFGLGPGMYNFHIPGLHWGGGVSLINSGWVVLLMDTGIAGVFLILYWLSNIIFRGLKMSFLWIKASDWQALYFVVPAIAGLISAITLNLGIGAFSSIVLFAGVTEAVRLRPK